MMTFAQQLLLRLVAATAIEGRQYLTSNAQRTNAVRCEQLGFLTLSGDAATLTEQGEAFVQYLASVALDRMDVSRPLSPLLGAALRAYGLEEAIRSEVADDHEGQVPADEEAMLGAFKLGLQRDALELHGKAISATAGHVLANLLGLQYSVEYADLETEVRRCGSDNDRRLWERASDEERAAVKFEAKSLGELVAALFDSAPMRAEDSASKSLN